MSFASDTRCECRKYLGDHEDGTPIYAEHNLPRTLTHHYPLPAIGAASIPLYRGPFSSDGKTYQGLVELGLKPIPRVRVRGRRATAVTVAELHALLQDQGVMGWVDRPGLSLPAQNELPQAPATGRFLVKRSTGVSWIGPFTPAPLTFNSGAHVEEVTFFVLNGWRAEDGLPTCHGGSTQRGRIQVTLGGEWDLRLEPRGDQPSTEILDYMRMSGTHTVTHVGRIRSASGQRFPADDVLSVLTMLDDLLSFAIGRVVSTALPVGWKGGQAVWTHWSAMRGVDVPASATSLLDDQHGAEQLAQLLQSGFTTYADPLRRAVFKNALGYYLTANFGSSEIMTTLLPVSGLQILAYGHFVQTLPASHPAHVLASAWEDKAAQGIVRDIVSLTGVDLAIPTYLTHLTATHSNAVTLAAKNKTPAPRDPLGSIVKMRNSVAHPNQKSLGKWTAFDWFEAGIYTMHLFDVAMLWWLDYAGTYKQRTAASSAILVPWANPTSTT